MKEVEIACALQNAISFDAGHHDLKVTEEDTDFIASCRASLGSGAANKALAEKLVEYCGVENALPVSTGTAALQLALQAVGVRPHEEVILPSMTFAATAHAVIHAGAVPHLVDGQFSINGFKLQVHLDQIAELRQEGWANKVTNRRIAAIIAVDLLGFPADFERLTKIADHYQLPLIEDAAGALGSSLNGKRCGSFGRAAIVSFNTNKIISGNGGGVIFSSEPWAIAYAERMATTGRIPHPWMIMHDSAGYNYRMPDLNACLILSQFERLSDILAYKKRLVLAYMGALEPLKEYAQIIQTNKWLGDPNYWLIAMHITPGVDRTALLKEMHQRGVKGREMFMPLHKLQHLVDCPRDSNLLAAEDLYANTVCLPSGMGLVT